MNGRPAFTVFGIETNVRAGRKPTLTLYFPGLSYYNAPGTTIGMNYIVRDGKSFVTSGQPAVPMRANQSLGVPLVFTPKKKHTYTVTVIANDPNGHTETRVATLKAI